MREEKDWSIYSFFLIGVMLFILILRWELLPNFLDIYYHLSSAAGFERAGGFVTHAFWEYAPSGRPNLYPPLFHFTILFFIKLGLPVIDIARFLDLISFPLLLLTIWFVARSVFNQRIAFFSVLIASSLYSLYLCGSNFIPVTIAFIFGLLSFWAIEKDKKLSAGILLGLAFYTHAQIPWVFILAFIIYALFARDKAQDIFTVLGLGILFSLPIIIHLLKNARFYNPGIRVENFIIEINLYLALSIFSLKKVFAEKKEYFFPLALTFAAMPFAFFYPYRYVSGQGLAGLIFLSAIALDIVYDPAEKFLDEYIKTNFNILIIAMILMTTVISPAIMIGRDGKLGLNIFNSTIINLMQFGKDMHRANDRSLYSDNISEVVDVIKKNSEKDAVIYTNMPMVETMLAPLSGRFSTGGMLREVSANGPTGGIDNADIIVWLKDPDAVSDIEPRPVIEKYRLKLIGETGMAYIYKNENDKNRAVIPDPIITNSSVLLLSIIIILIISKQFLKNFCF